MRQIQTVCMDVELSCVDDAGLKFADWRVGDCRVSLDGTGIECDTCPEGKDCPHVRAVVERVCKMELGR